MAEGEQLDDRMPVSFAVPPVSVDEASAGECCGDCELAPDEGRCNDLGEFRRRAFSAAAKEGKAFALRWQIGPAPDSPDD